MALEMTRRRVTFEVLGVAEPKGSAKAFVPKSWAVEAVKRGQAPRAVVTTDNPKSKDWQHSVAERAQTVAGDGLFVGPVSLTIVFRLPRPKSLPRHVLHHTKKPDVSKLTRCVEDALTGILYLDDAQIVAEHVYKVYAAPAAPTCAVVTLEEAVAPDPTQVGLDIVDSLQQPAMEGLFR